MKKLPKIVAFALVVLAAIFVYRQFIFYPAALQNCGSNEMTIDFTIERGESVASIAERLEQIGVVNSDWVLTKYLRANALDTKVEAGHFEFRGGETVPEVAEILRAGQVEQISLTILEGWNSFEIDEKLTEMGLIESNDFALFVREGGSTAGNEPGTIFVDRPVASLEGYIFPATYRIDPQNFSVKN